MIVITGASGQLGRLVIENLLKTVSPSEIVAAVRSPQKVADLAQRGVVVREADYTQPETLDRAFAGADKVLLISSSEIGQRFGQHKNAIDAAKRANVSLLAYTSILKADTSPLPIAEEHKQTEAYLKESGVPHVVLRNGWYTENYAASIASALQHNAFIGSAQDGRIASATRADYAEAAASVLVNENQAGKVYELAGDSAYTLSDFASEIASQSGKEVSYADLPEADFKAALLGAGLPEPLANLLAESDVGVTKGGLDSDSRNLSQLIGRTTTPYADTIKEALSAL